MSAEATAGPINRVVPEPGEDCLHEEVDYLDLIRITTRDVVQTWIPGSPVFPGTEWCYTHRRWEKKEKSNG